MKDKVLLGIILLLIFVTCIGIGFYLTKINEIHDNYTIGEVNIDNLKVTDECVEEGKELIAVNSGKIVKEEQSDEAYNDHYVLREKDGKVVVYKLDEDDNEELYLDTEISSKYLPEVDKVSISNGIFVNGKEALNNLLQDFE